LLENNYFGQGRTENLNGILRDGQLNFRKHDLAIWVD